jgi:hypothetical protein
MSRVRTLAGPHFTYCPGFLRPSYRQHVTSLDVAMENSILERIYGFMRADIDNLAQTAVHVLNILVAAIGSTMYGSICRLWSLIRRVLGALPFDASLGPLNQTQIVRSPPLLVTSRHARALQLYWSPAANQSTGNSSSTCCSPSTRCR